VVDLFGQGVGDEVVEPRQPPAGVRRAADERPARFGAGFGPDLDGRFRCSHHVAAVTLQRTPLATADRVR